MVSVLLTYSPEEELLISVLLTYFPEEGAFGLCVVDLFS